MLLGKEQNIIGHDPHQVRAFAEAHLRAYGPDDIDILMKSTSPRGGIWAGMAPPHGATLIGSPEEIRATYLDLLGAVNAQPTRIFALYATDWYVFFEGVSPVLDKASGQVIENQAVCIFGNDEHGTAVDMAWPLAIGAATSRPGRDAKGEARSELVDLAAHEQRIAGFASGDLAAASAGLADDCALFLPCFDPNDRCLEVMVKGPEAYRGYISNLHKIYTVAACKAGAILVGDSYVFSDFSLDLVGKGSTASITARYALAEILGPDGLVIGMLGFATKL